MFQSDRTGDMQTPPTLDTHSTLRQDRAVNCTTALSRDQNIQATNASATLFSSTNTDNVFKNSQDMIMMSHEGDIKGVAGCISRGEDINKVFIKAPATNSFLSFGRFVSDLVLHSGDTALIAAVKKNHLDVATLLLENGACIEVCSHVSWQGMTALTSACATGSTEMLDLLSKYRANIDFQNDNGATALMYSCQNNHVVAAKYLVTHGANTELLDVKGFDAMLCACTNCCDEIVDLLIENGAKVTPQCFLYAVQRGHIKLVQKFVTLVGDINCQVEKPFDYLLQNSVGRNLPSNDAPVLGDTALIIAARRGYIAIAKLLLDEGIDVTIENAIKFNAFITATEKNNSSVVEVLLSTGSGRPTGAMQHTVSMRDIHLSGELLLDATKHHNLDVIRYFIAHGGNVNYVQAETDDTALSIACDLNFLDIINLLLHSNATIDTKVWQKAVTNGRVNVVKRFIIAGVHIDQQYDYGKTALIQATTDGRLDVVQTLIAAGANVEMKNMFGMTALHMSFRYNNPKLTEILLRAGANANAANDNGEIPLMEAIFYHNLAVIYAIIDRTKDINTQRCDGNTALMIAILQNSKMCIIQKILGRGADVNIQNIGGETALIIAVRMGNVPLARMLIRMPGFACINGQDEEGKTACTHASMNNNFELVKLLLRNDADASIGVENIADLFAGLKSDSDRLEALDMHRRESNWRKRKHFLMVLFENSYLLSNQNKNIPYTEKKYEKVLSNQNLVRIIAGYL